MQKVAFICSPYARLDILVALDIARLVAIKAKDDGYIPLSPVIAFDNIYKETNAREREVVLKASESLLMKCEIVYVAQTQYKISDGMKREINLAKCHNIPIRFISV